MLKVWLEKRQHYRLREAVNDVKEWYKRGYFHRDVWKRLRNTIPSEYLPSYSEIDEMTKRLDLRKCFWCFLNLYKLSRCQLK